jgi:hypothetical protein
MCNKRAKPEQGVGGVLKKLMQELSEKVTFILKPEG